MDPSDRLSGKDLDAYWAQVVDDAWAWGEEAAAQRDRLLRYVHADDRLRRATTAEHEDAFATWFDARKALLDAGDLTEDDDGD